MGPSRGLRRGFSLEVIFEEDLSDFCSHLDSLDSVKEVGKEPDEISVDSLVEERKRQEDIHSLNPSFTSFDAQFHIRDMESCFMEWDQHSTIPETNNNNTKKQEPNGNNNKTSTQLENGDGNLELDLECQLNLNLDLGLANSTHEIRNGRRSRVSRREILSSSGWLTHDVENGDTEDEDESESERKRKLERVDPDPDDMESGTETETETIVETETLPQFGSFPQTMTTCDNDNMSEVVGGSGSSQWIHDLDGATSTLNDADPDADDDTDSHTYAFADPYDEVASIASSTFDCSSSESTTTTIPNTTNSRGIRERERQSSPLAEEEQEQEMIPLDQPLFPSKHKMNVKKEEEEEGQEEGQEDDKGNLKEKDYGVISIGGENENENEGDCVRNVKRVREIFERTNFETKDGIDGEDFGISPCLPPRNLLKLLHISNSTTATFSNQNANQNKKSRNKLSSFSPSTTETVGTNGVDGINGTVSSHTHREEEKTRVEKDKKSTPSKLNSSSFNLTHLASYDFVDLLVNDKIVIEDSPDIFQTVRSTRQRDVTKENSGGGGGGAPTCTTLRRSKSMGTGIYEESNENGNGNNSTGNPSCILAEEMPAPNIVKNVRNVFERLCFTNNGNLRDKKPLNQPHPKTGNETPTGNGKEGNFQPKFLSSVKSNPTSKIFRSESMRQIPTTMAMTMTRNQKGQTEQSKNGIKKFSGAAGKPILLSSQTEENYNKTTSFKSIPNTTFQVNSKEKGDDVKRQNSKTTTTKVKAESTEAKNEVEKEKGEKKKEREWTKKEGNGEMDKIENNGKMIGGKLKSKSSSCSSSPSNFGNTSKISDSDSDSSSTVEQLGGVKTSGVKEKATTATTATASPQLVQKEKGLEREGNCSSSSSFLVGSPSYSYLQERRIKRNESDRTNKSDSQSESSDDDDDDSCKSNTSSNNNTKWIPDEVLLRIRSYGTTTTYFGGEIVGKTVKNRKVLVKNEFGIYGDFPFQENEPFSVSPTKCCLTMSSISQLQLQPTPTPGINTQSRMDKAQGEGQEEDETHRKRDSVTSSPRLLPKNGVWSGNNDDHDDECPSSPFSLPHPTNHQHPHPMDTTPRIVSVFPKSPSNSPNSKSPTGSIIIEGRNSPEGCESPISEWTTMETPDSNNNMRNQDKHDLNPTNSFHNNNNIPSKSTNFQNHCCDANKKIRAQQQETVIAEPKFSQISEGAWF